MAQYTYKIPRVTDRQIAAALAKLASEFGPFVANIHVLDQSLGNVSFPEQPEAIWQTTLAQDGDLVNHFGVEIQGLSLHYYRGGQQRQPWEKSPALDDISIEPNGINEARLHISARILETFRPIQLPPAYAPDELLNAQRALQESTFARLELQFEKLVEKTIKLRDDFDERTAAKEADLEARAGAAREQFAKEQAEARDGLTKERNELDERRKALDDSDNTFARRQIRDRMLTDVATRVRDFGVAPATSRARRPVALGMLLLIGLFTTIFAWTVWELLEEKAHIAYLTRSVTAFLDQARNAGLSGDEQGTKRLIDSAAMLSGATWDRIALWIRLTITSLALAGSVIYYIRWQNQWAQQFATTELSLQQFHIDVNRANWVVETCLEWRKESNSDVPLPLIESMTRGLFVTANTPAPVLHPADELASALMGSASKVSLDLGGSRVDIDKPAKIPKALKSSPP